MDSLLPVFISETRGISMKRTKKEIVEQTEEWLDERWSIVEMTNNRPQDVAYYEGAIKAIEFLGYSWRRDENGKHKLIQN